MSSAYVDLILYQINNCFGERCRDICRVLLYNDWTTITDLRNELKNTRPNEIKEYLDLLINFNLIQSNFDGETHQTYHFDLEQGLSFLRYDRYIKCIDKKFGKYARIIMQIFCRFGNLYLMQLLEHFNILTKNNNINVSNGSSWLEVVVNTVNMLVSKKILEASLLCLSKSGNANRFQNKNGLIITEIDAVQRKYQKIHDNNNKLGAPSKRSYRQMTNSVNAVVDEDSDEGDHGNGNSGEQDCTWTLIQYRINSVQMNFMCTSDIIVEDVALTLDGDAARLMEIFIDTVMSTDQQTKTVSINVLKKLFKTTTTFNTTNNNCGTVNDDEDTNFRECLYLLTTNEFVQYIEIVGDSDNTQSLLRFSVGTVIKQLVTKVLKDLVRVLFDENGLRIFSFLFCHSHIDEAALPDKIFISSAQINALLPNMVMRGFISRLELSKTRQYFDEPLVSLLHVDLEKVVRNEIETCYQSLYRLLVRCNVEDTRKMPVVQKIYDVNTKGKEFQTIDGDGAIAAITELDMQSVATVYKVLQKCYSVEQAIHTSLFLFESFIQHVNENENF